LSFSFRRKLALDNFSVVFYKQSIELKKSMRTSSLKEIEDHLFCQAWVAPLSTEQITSARLQVRQHIETWLSAGMPHERSADHQALTNPVEVLNWMTAQGLARTDGFWLQHHVQAARDLCYRLHDCRDGQIPQPHSPNLPSAREFKVQIERTYAMAQPVGERTRLRLPVPLNALGQTVTQIDIEDIPGWPRELTDSRAEWRVPKGWHGLVRLSLKATLTCAPNAPLTPSIQDNERHLWTQMNEGWVESVPEVVELSKQLRANSSDDLSFVESIYRWTLAHLKFGAIDYADLPAQGALQQVLRTGWTDCQLWSALFCALCRSGGVPARMVSGYQLHRERPFHHFWAQAWIEGVGWKNWDSATWRLAAAGQDPQWFELFNGHMEYRLVLQILPRTFTGAGSIRFPTHWHMLYHPTDEGVATRFINSSTQQLIYEERCNILN